MRLAAARVLWAAASAASISLSGCQAPGPPDGPTRMVLRAADREAFMDRTISLLRELDFAPNRVDREAGTILAGPTTSGQWFEFWRRDVHGAYQVLESSIHTIRRDVAVSIRLADPSADEAACEVTVEVNKQRLAAPQRQITTASGALAIYSERIPTTEGLRKAQSPDAAWVPLGRDALLEEYLLNRIAELSQGAAEVPPAAEPPPATGATAGG